MRNNRLHITYRGDMRSMPVGFQESFKCGSLPAAKKAVAKRNKDNVHTAIFKDKDGVETILVNKGMPKSKINESVEEKAKKLFGL